jgi:HK97 family phage portal protein
MARARKAEVRSTAENPLVPISASNFLQYFGFGSMGMSASGVHVTIDTALGVPAVWCAVNFMANEIASLPMQVFRRKGDGRERVRSALATMLSDAVNEDMTSFAWRKYLFTQVLTGGRAFTFIERNAAGTVMNLWPIDPTTMTVKLEGGQRRYIEKRSDRKEYVYKASEIIDISFMPKADLVGHYGPIATNKDVIGNAIALTQYSSKFFQNGGVPPFAVTGNFATPAAMKRATDDLHEAVLKAAKEQRQALVMPIGLEIKAIGSDPDKTQLIESNRYAVEQIARIYSLPPTFLQDLTHGTFSNTEQQDLQFVKHTLNARVEQFEQEMNLKIFGRRSTVQYIELNVDGLLRGDFKTRMDGYASAIQHGILKPNEARARENMPEDAAGNRLLVQGAMVPLEKAGETQQPAPTPAAPADPEGDPSDAA